MPRKLVNRFFVALPPEGSTGVFGVAEVNTEPPTKASFAAHQAIRPQAHHSGAEAEPSLPSPKGYISQNHINSSGSPRSPSINNLPQAGRLKPFLSAWEQITKDPWVLQVVSGYQREFINTLVQQKPVLLPHVHWAIKPK